MYPNVSLFIDGAWTQAAAGRTLPIVNPATGDAIATLAHAERTGLDRALVPFGGVKGSGYRSEGSSEAIENYLNTKFVTQAGL